MLERLESPAGNVIMKFEGLGGGGPLRIQTASGIYAEVRLPSNSGTACKSIEHLTSAGHLSVHVDMCRKITARHAAVDFQPLACRWPRQLFICNGELLEVVALPPARHREVWRRVGAPEDIVALKLVADARNRAGFWLFSRRYFVRVVGLPRGEGLVAGTCCRSLGELARLTSLEDVETELRAHYEALDGEIEAPGRLRIRCDAWNASRAGTLLNDGGAVVVSRDGGQPCRVTLRLPSGGEEHWQVLEWAFDPFSVSAPAAAPPLARPPPRSVPSNARPPDSKLSATSRSASSKSSGSGSGRSRRKGKAGRRRSSSGSSSRSHKRLKPRHRSVSAGRPANAAAIPPPVAPRAVGVAIPPPSATPGPAPLATPVEPADAPPRSFGFGAPRPAMPQPFSSKPFLAKETPAPAPVPPALGLLAPDTAVPSTSLPHPCDPFAPTVAKPAPLATGIGGPTLGGPNLLATAVMEFLARNFPQGVDESAAQALLSAPRQVQQSILRDKSIQLQGWENPSAVLMAIIRRATSAGLEVAATAANDDVARWASQNNLDQSAVSAIRSLPPELQRKVMDMGPVLGSNPSAIVMGRIRLARTNQGMGMPYR